MLKIDSFILSMFYSNSYVVSEDGNAFVVDIGDKPQNVIEFIKKNNLKPQFVLLTHGHTDHADGAEEFLKEFDVPVYLNSKDRINIDNKDMWFAKLNVKTIEADENTQITFNGKKITVFETPGHTTGGVCYLIEDNLFTGDTLFRLSIGRTDFKGGSFEALMDSIKNKLFKLDDNTKVFPGHNSPSTIETEKKYNRFIK